MNSNIPANQDSQRSQGVDQTQGVQPKQHYEVKEKGGVGALYIGGKKCEVTVGNKVVTNPEQLRKLVDVFKQSQVNATLEKDETLLLSNKSIKKISSGETTKLYSAKKADSGAAYTEGMKAFFTLVKTDKVAKDTFPAKPEEDPTKKAPESRDSGPPLDLSAPVTSGPPPSPPPDRPPPPLPEAAPRQEEAAPKAPGEFVRPAVPQYTDEMVSNFDITEDTSSQSQVSQGAQEPINTHSGDLRPIPEHLLPPAQEPPKASEVPKFDLPPPPTLPGGAQPPAVKGNLKEAMERLNVQAAKSRTEVSRDLVDRLGGRKAEASIQQSAPLAAQSIPSNETVPLKDLTNEQLASKIDGYKADLKQADNRINNISRIVKQMAEDEDGEEVAIKIGDKEFSKPSDALAFIIQEKNKTEYQLKLAEDESNRRGAIFQENEGKKDEVGQIPATPVEATPSKADTVSQADTPPAAAEAAPLTEGSPPPSPPPPPPSSLTSPNTSFLESIKNLNVSSLKKTEPLEKLPIPPETGTGDLNSLLTFDFATAMRSPTAGRKTEEPPVPGSDDEWE